MAASPADTGRRASAGMIRSPKLLMGCSRRTVSNEMEMSRSALAADARKLVPRDLPVMISVVESVGG